MTTNYIIGDATKPAGTGPRVIVHCCNDMGGWGSGFVLAISARWKEPEAAYRTWHATGTWEGVPFGLGEVQLVEVESGLWVANLVGQHRYGKCSNPDDPFVRYDAVETGLKRVAAFASAVGASIHMPRIGCGLAGGTWWEMGPIVDRALADADVFVYDLGQGVV